MNQDIVKGSWLQIKGDVKKFFGKLTDDDMLQVEGNRDKIVGKLQERYGLAKDAADKQVSDWVQAADDSWFSR